MAISRRLFTRQPARIVAALRAIAFWFAVATVAIALAGLFAWNNPEAPVSPNRRQA